MARSLRLSTAFALLALNCACEEETGLTVLPPADFFEPAAVDFGVQPVGAAAERTVELVNRTGGDVNLRLLDFEPQLDVFAVRTSEGSVRGRRLAVGQRIELVIVFGANDEATFESKLRLQTDDAQIELPVRGEGRIVTPARFEGPSQVVFATPVPIGGLQTQPLTLTNAGQTPGRLMRVGGANGFSITGPAGGPLPAETIAPGARVELEVAFSPTLVGPNEAELLFEAEGGARTTLIARGEGVEAGNLTCDVSAVDLGAVERFAQARRSVRCTATGGPYQLAGVSLQGAEELTIENVTPPSGLVDTLTFEVVLRAGGSTGPRTGTVLVRPTTGDAIQLAARADVVSPPTNGLAVQVAITWPDSPADLDLHLVRGGGQPFDDDDDCHAFSKIVDFGTPGEARDDAYLDEDDTRGPGSEVITMVEANDGTYDVFVAYHQPTGAGPQTFSLTWSIAAGAVTGQADHTLSACGEFLRVGRIDMSGPSFTPAAEVLPAYDDFEGGCQ